MAITVDKARSVRVRRSNSQSGKNAPWRSFVHRHVDRADTGIKVAVAIPVAVVDPLGGDNRCIRRRRRCQPGRRGSG